MSEDAYEYPTSREFDASRIEHKPYFGPNAVPESERDSNEWRDVERSSLTALHKMGIVDMDESGELVLDLDAVRNFSYREFKASIPVKAEGGVSALEYKRHVNNTRKLFVNIFWDRKVIIKGAENEGLTELLYIPDDKEDALNVQRIRSAKGEIAVWEIGRNKNSFWDKQMPTRERGFQSELTIQEAAIPYIIYKGAHGRRDEDGNLWVDRKPGDPSKGRQKFSGKWITDNIGIKGSTNARWDDSPRRVVEELGAEWEIHNLLTVDDIPEKNSDKSDYRVTSDMHGYVYIGSRQIYLGPSYAGARVVRMSPHEYSVVDPGTGESRMVFSTIIKSDSVRDCVLMESTDSSGHRRTTVRIPGYAINRSDEQGFGSSRAYIYKDGRRSLTRVNLGEASKGLLQYKGTLSHELREIFDNLSVKDQVALLKIDENSTDADFSQVDEIVRRGGVNGAKILADAFYEGGVSPDLLKLSNLNTQNLQEVLGIYVESNEAMQSLIDEIRVQLSEREPLSDNEAILLSRIAQAFQYKSIEISAIAAQGNVDLVKSHLNDISELARVTKNVIEDPRNLNFRYNSDPKQNAETGEYTLPDGSRLILTVRPEASSKAQGRVSLTYTKPGGERTNIRVDHDEHGISLDLASRGTEVSQALQNAGKTYHSQEVFEDALDADFTRFASKIPGILNWPSR